MGLRVYSSPGWHGVWVGRTSVYVRDRRRHRHLFSERERIGRRLLVRAGRWELWLGRRSSFTRTGL